MIDDSIVYEAATMLLEAAPRGSEVILFGSFARGQTTAKSDVDFLVVEPEVSGRIAEAARLSRVIRSLRIPADILVVSRGVYQEWKDTPNTVIYEAAKDGKVFREVA